MLTLITCKRCAHLDHEWFQTSQCLSHHICYIQRHRLFLVCGTLAFLFSCALVAYQAFFCLQLWGGGGGSYARFSLVTMYDVTR